MSGLGFFSLSIRSSFKARALGALRARPPTPISTAHTAGATHWDALGQLQLRTELEGPDKNQDQLNHLIIAFVVCSVIQTQWIYFIP